MDFLFLIIGIIVGAGAMWFVMKAKIDSQDTQDEGISQQEYQHWLKRKHE